MTSYRIYLRNASGICGRDDFDAEGDEAAISVGALLADACSDVCSGFELWQGAHLVCTRRVYQLPSLSEVTERRQALAAQREEALQHSRFLVAQSRRLLDQLEAYRSTRHPPPTC